MDLITLLVPSLSNLVTTALAFSKVRRPPLAASLRPWYIVALPSAIVVVAGTVLGGASSPREFALSDALASGVACFVVTGPVLVVALVLRRWATTSPSRGPVILVPLGLGILLGAAFPLVGLVSACVIAGNCL